MTGEITVERLIIELQSRPMSTAREIHRRMAASNPYGRSKINQLLYKHKSIFLKHEPLTGTYAPRWSLVEGASPTPQQLSDGRKVCLHCGQVPEKGLEEICRIGACVRFIVN
jgi:hypothetical protein